MAETSSKSSMSYAEEPGNKARKQLACRVIVGVAISLMWVAFTIFILIYHRPELFGGQINSSVTTDVGSSVNQSSIQSTCSPELYTGEICRGVLQMYQQCLINGYGNSSDIHIPSGMDQERLEEQIRTLVSFLPLLNPTPQCVEELLPLLCFYYLELCDSSGRRQQPSSEQCETIRDETCASEFDTAVALVGNEQLPRCELLPATTVECTMVTALGTTDIQNSSSNSSDSQQAPVLTCREGFYETEESELRVCKPQCAGWSLYPRQLDLAVTSLFIISAAVGLIAGVVVLVISCFDRKRMLRFPSMFIVYQSATMLVYTVMILIGLSFQSRLFCSSTDLIDSIANPTPYCKLTGILFPYVYVQLLVWWLVHVTVLYWGIRFPFHARSFETSGKNKYIHLTAVVLGLCLPAMPPIIVGSFGDPTLIRFPVLVCSSGKAGMSFYSTILPSAVLQTVGCSILILIGWTISQEHLSRLPKHQRVTIEVKVLINILYLIGASVLLVITLGVSYLRTPEDANTVGKLLTTYFLCESKGVRPESPNNSCDRSRLNEVIPIQLPLDVCFILLALYPLVNLTFAINVTKCKQFGFNTPSSNSMIVNFKAQ